jgi:hypothetical protein
VLTAPVGEIWVMGDALPVAARMVPTKAVLVKEYFILKVLLRLSEGECRRFLRCCEKYFGEQEIGRAKDQKI